MPWELVANVVADGELKGVEDDVLQVGPPVEEIVVVLRILARCL